MLRHRKRKKIPYINLEDPLYREFADILGVPLQKWGWVDCPCKECNNLAKEELRLFLSRAKELLPKAALYDFEPFSYTEGGVWYLQRLLQVKECLDVGNWNNACHELYDVVHFDMIQDRRILYTIIGLLEAYLCGG